VLPGCVVEMNVIPARMGRRPELTPEESMVEHVAEVVFIAKNGVMLMVIVREIR
jgi:hypothetical protein